METLKFIVALAILSLMPLSLASASTDLYVNPQESVVQPGENFTVSIYTDTNDSLFAADVELHFDPSILEGIDSGDGGFLGSDGESVSVQGNDIDNGAGVFQFYATRTGTTSGVNGSGAIANITFNVVSAGVSNLTIVNNGLPDENIQPITPNIINGEALANSLPEATNLDLSPSSPKTDDSLTGSYSYSDADGHSESGTEIRWYRDGSLQSGYNDQLNIPSSATSKGEEWYFSVKPKDGISFGQVEESPHVNIQNTIPVADNDSAATNEDQSVSVDVLANDDDLDGDSLSINSIVSSPSHGTASIVSGEIEYVPDQNYNGQDSLVYEVTDGEDTDTATLSIEINAVNDDPVARNDSAATNEDQSVSVDVLANDSDVEDGVPQLDTIIIGPSHGTASIVSGEIEYTPNLNYNGQDTFKYRVSDSGAKTDTATVIVNINAVNDDPVLSAIGNKTVIENNNLLFNVSGSDVDSGDTLTYSASNLPQGATFSGQEFNWTPMFNQSGIYQITFEVTDGQAVDSETINVTVGNNNRAPLISSYSPTNSTFLFREGLNLSFTQSSSDPDGEALFYSWILDGSEEATTKDWVFSPGVGQCNVTHQIELEVTDGQATVSENWEVEVALRGDVDLDGDVDIFDLSALGQAYGTTVGDANWNPKADIHPFPSGGIAEGDGDVDIFDLSAAGLNYDRVC